MVEFTLFILYLVVSLLPAVVMPMAMLVSVALLSVTGCVLMGMYGYS